LAAADETLTIAPPACVPGAPAAGRVVIRSTASRAQ
jgi:hypothetical protein